MHVFRGNYYLNTTLAEKFQFEEKSAFKKLCTTADNESTLTSSTIIGKIIGVSKVVQLLLCPSCSRRTTAATEKSVHCDRCNCTILSTACVSMWSLNLLISDVETNQCLPLFFKNDQVHELKEVLDLTLDSEDDLAKQLFNCTRFVNVSFDITNKMVLKVEKH